MAELEHYVREVWSYHCERRGSEMPLMSPQEFDMVAGWYGKGIRLSTVLRGISDTPRVSRTLSYYRPAVYEAFRMWKRAMVGMST